MRSSKFLCAVASACLVFASAAFGTITLGDINKTITNGIAGGILQDSLTGLSPFTTTQTLQRELNEDPVDPYFPGAHVSAYVQQTVTISFEPSDVSYIPSGHSFDFNVASTTGINNGVSSVGDSTAIAVTTIAFTLDKPTAWTLNEQGDNGPDWEFLGGQLYAGPVTNQPSDWLLPVAGQIHGSGSGVLQPGSYTYIVQSGGSDDHDTEQTQQSVDFALSEVPEPLAAMPVLIGALALMRRR